MKPETTHWSRRLVAFLRRSVIKASLLLGSILISFFLGEGLIRLFAPQQLIVHNPELWGPADTYGIRHRPDVRILMNTGEGTVLYATDSNGFRVDPKSNGERHAADVSILMLGDSFLEALAVDYDKTIPEVIRQQLETRLEKSVRAVNTGVAGWGPNHYYLQARESLASERFDLGIVFLYVANDLIKEQRMSFARLQPAARHQLRLPRNLGHDEIVDAVFFPVNDFFELRSHLFMFLRTRSRVLLARAGLTPYYFPDIFLKSEKNSPRWGVTAAVCSAIQAEFAAHNTPVFFVLLPAVYQVDEERFRQWVRMFQIPEDSVDLQQPNRMLKGEFRQHQLELVDILAHLRELAEAAPLYGQLDQHFNEEGHRSVAEYLIPTIQEHLSRQPETSE